MTLRVLQVIETGGPGGAETVFASLSEGLASRGHAVHCMSGMGTWLPDELLRRQLKLDLLEFRGAFDVPLFAKIQRAIDRYRVDVVHAHLFDGAVYAAAAARMRGVPCVVTLHGQVDVRAAGWKGAIKRRTLLWCAHSIVAVSGALKREFAETFGSAASHFRVIHNGVALSEICSPPLSSQKTGATAGTPNAPWQLVAVGNIRAPKGYPYLLEAMAVLRQRGYVAHLDIVGEPDREGLFNELQSQVRALGIEGLVQFRGFIERPAPLIMSSDALVLASTKEGFSLVTIEAMHVGTPVIATRSGGPEEILEDGLTGFLVTPGSAEALADGIVRALGAPEYTAGLVSRAQSEAKRRFGLGSMVEAYEELYYQAVKRERQVPPAASARTTTRRSSSDT